MPPSAGAPSRGGALEGWRVVEWCEGVAATFCGKILSDLGAEVVRVEPPSGRADRCWPPRRPDGVSGRSVYVNTGKASVVVESGAAGAQRLRQLVADADVLITDRLAGDLAVLGEPPPTLIGVSILPFGATGPYASYASHHLTVFHAGGEGSILPSGPGWEAFPDRPPIQLGSELAFFDAGWNAAVAVLAACYDLHRSGRAQHVDVSMQESQLTLNRTRLSRFNNDSVVLHREGNRYGITGMLRCADGWVQLVGMRDEHWDRLIASGQAPELADARFATAADRATNQPALGEAIAAWCAARAKTDVVDVLSALGAPIGIYAVPADLLESTQLTHRGFFQDVEDGRGGRVTLPGAPYRLSRTPVVLRPTPALGSFAGFASSRLEHGATGGDGRRLLEGVRVLDFTWAAAGPYATLLLAFLGAEVIKVETTRRPDPARRGFLADYGGINRSPNFNELNLNKRTLQLDLTRPEGLDVVHRLVAKVDVVVDNFRPGVMERFGLGPQALLDANPGLVVASSSANGSTGPEAMAAGLASIFGATGGLSDQTGYRDGPPTEVGESTDYRSANALTVAILAALLHRARTGEGQHVDVASREVVAASAPDALLAHVLGVAWAPRLGNGHREMAPHDVYPCAGPDAWLAVAVGNAHEWSALCDVLGQEKWVDQYQAADDRRAAVDVIDAAIAAWTQPRRPAEAFAALQAAGVPAAPVMTNAALADDPHLAARAVFVDVEHPEIGRQRVMRAPWIFSSSSCEVRRHGPTMGQDNEFVLEKVLGMAPTWREQLAEALR